MKENDGDATHQQSPLKIETKEKLDVGSLKIERSIAAPLSFGIHKYFYK